MFGTGKALNLIFFKNCRVPWTPQKGENLGQEGAKLGKKDQNWAFWAVVFHENTSRKFKFKSEVAELLWVPQFYCSIAPMYQPILR